jgi:hypothetical protein
VTDPHEPDGRSTEPTADDPDEQRRRRRRLAEVFGDVLPETTSDEREDDPSDPADETSQDRWLRRQVPPHHG